MKVAVLGSNGFLGNLICQRLDCEILPVSRSTFDLNSYVETRQWLEKFNPDVVINCATSGGKTKMGDLNFQDIQNNLGIFINFFNNSDYVKKFINIGSGAEFDVKTNINLAKEIDILNSVPNDSYGYSKNIIARMVLEKDNFFTLRLFGCFDSTEPDFRLFKKLLADQNFKLINRQFDYISADDFIKILKYYVRQPNLPKDLNCVYQNKLYLNEILDKFNKKFSVVETSNINYTGNGDLLALLDLELEGLDIGIEKYKSKI
jgi:nucleoside-diphosphate-sugar epimerase